MRTLDIRTRRRRSDRRRPGFDLLEARIALSGADDLTSSGGFGPIAFDPPPGAVLLHAPDAITVTFDRPIDPSTVAFDFRIDRVGPDGTSVPIPSDNDLTEAPSPDGASIAITTTRPLPDGQYRLVLLGTAGLATIDGVSAAPASGEDLSLDEFTVRRPGIGLGNAGDLGYPAAPGIDITGSLDPAAPGNAVALYRIEIPQGPNRRLAVQVDAARIGSPLTSALALFDAQGRAIATDQIGRPDFPADPYLFAGVAPGIYYIGVSGAGNLPGLPGGYDPASATPGIAPASDVPGGFRLRIVADPIVAPTHLRTFVLNHADPNDPVPTGLTLQFDGPIDASRLRANAAGSISVVDASGHPWQVDAVGYDEVNAAVTFLFDRSLPPGPYTVQLPGQGGISDLAGMSPVATALRPGLLGAFFVPATPLKADPYDLGPVSPAALNAGLKERADLGPGASVTYRIDLTLAGLYDLQTSTEIGQADVFAEFGGRTVQLDAGPIGVQNSHLLKLPAGVLMVRVAGGASPSSVGLTLKLPGGAFDSLLDNGVGRTQAMDLRLIAPGMISSSSAPGVVDSGVGPAVPTSGGPTVAVPIAIQVATPAVEQASPSGPSVGPISYVAYLIASGGVIGHPSADLGAVAVVGPVGGGGFAALALNGESTVHPIGVGGHRRANRTVNPGAILETRPVDVAEDDHAEGDDESEAILADLDGGENSDPVPSIAPAPGLVSRAQAAIADMLGTAMAPNSETDEALLAAIGPPSAAGVSEGEEPRVETAALSNVFTIAVMVLSVARYHQQIGAWLARSGRRIVARRGQGVASPRPA